MAEWIVEVDNDGSGTFALEALKSLIASKKPLKKEMSEDSAAQKKAEFTEPPKIEQQDSIQSPA